MKVVVLEREKEIFSCDHAECVTVPSVSGEMCVYPNHISIVTLLQAGKINVSYKESGADQQKSFDIIGGIFSFKQNQAVFLVQIA